MRYKIATSCAALTVFLLATETFSNTLLNQPQEVQILVNTGYAGASNLSAVQIESEQQAEHRNARENTEIEVDRKHLQETGLSAVNEAAEALRIASRALEEANVVSAEELTELVRSALEVAEKSLNSGNANERDDSSNNVIVKSKKFENGSSYEVIIKSASEELDAAAERYVKALEGTHGTWPVVGGFQSAIVATTSTPNPIVSVTPTRLLLAPMEFTQRQGAFLGITMAVRVDSPESGVEVAGIVPKSGAEEAGIQIGDRILAVGPVKLDSLDNPQQALMGYLKKREPGDAVKLKLERDRNEMELTVVTKARPRPEELQENFDIYLDQTRSLFFGFPALASLNPSLGKYFNTDSGALVLNAGMFGELESGDVITEIDGKAVKSKQQAYRLLSSSGDSQVLVTVVREKREVDLILRLGEFSFPVNDP